jgi:hypothetical protein
VGMRRKCFKIAKLPPTKKKLNPARDTTAHANCSA